MDSLLSQPMTLKNVLLIVACIIIIFMMFYFVFRNMYKIFTM